MISLIISTRNRAESLSACLDRVRQLAPPPEGWELILVDNGSTDGTGERIKNFQKTCDFPVKLLREERVGLPCARNAGTAAAAGEILAFTDDDCYVAPDYLLRVREPFADPAIGYVGGSILLHDETDARASITGLTTVRLLPAGRLLPPGIIQGANFACRRRALEDVGGFDPDLGPGTPFNCEEIDCLARIAAAGWAGGFFPDIVVFHHHRRKPGSPELARLLNSYARGIGAYYAKWFLDGRWQRDDVRQVYRNLRAMLEEGRAATALLEVVGGCHYLVHRLLNPRETSGMPGSRVLS